MRPVSQRFVCLWFPHLKADWFVLRNSSYSNSPLVFTVSVRGKMTIVASSVSAESLGIFAGMLVADAKALVADLKVVEDKPNRAEKLLTGLGEWCIRFTPLVAVDVPDGLTLDVTGCTHLWGSEQAYLAEIVSRLQSKGYEVKAAIADTIGAAWALCRYGSAAVTPSGLQTEALRALPPAALRIDPSTLERLEKLGFNQIAQFIGMPRSVLRRRFGETLLNRLAQAVGAAREFIEPLVIAPPYYEKLPCLEPISTATGIQIAIKILLENICNRLNKEGKGLRTAVLSCYRVDDRIEKATVQTSRPSHNASHLFKLFELKISEIEPALGIDLFSLEVMHVEDMQVIQQSAWALNSLSGSGVSELMDKIAGKVGVNVIHRYFPDARHLPERSVKEAQSLDEKPEMGWPTEKRRPIALLAHPEKIEVTALMPDYPPMLFRYQNKIHTIDKADGPERIESEWWTEGHEKESRQRDYYVLEDLGGSRYWVFRLGNYETERPQWYLHGFFS